MLNLVTMDERYCFDHAFYTMDWLVVLSLFNLAIRKALRRLLFPLIVAEKRAEIQENFSRFLH